MSIHLLIIARHNPVQQEFEHAANAARQTENFLVERCDSPGELIGTVRKVVKIKHQRIKLLDIYGHGRRGKQFLGNEVLFGIAERDEIAQALDDFLTENATVRLLGCETAVGLQGKQLLSAVQRNLGKLRTVHGMIANIDGRFAFGESGFMAKREEPFLFSSTELQNDTAPTQRARQRALRNWYARVAAP